MGDITNMFGNFVGGTLVALPATLPNAFYAGIFDLSDPAPGQPATAGAASSEALPGHAVPVQTRQIILVAAAAYLVLSTLIYSGRAGRDVASLLSLAMRLFNQNAGNGQGAGASPAGQQHVERLIDRVVQEAATAEADGAGDEIDAGAAAPDGGPAAALQRLAIEWPGAGEESAVQG